MGEENPLLNFRVPQSVKDTFSLHAKKAGAEVGPMLRQWCMERIAVERVLELLKSVDLPEVLRRLSVPSSVMSNHTALTVHAAEQTSENFVRQDRELVLQGHSAGGSVLQVKRRKLS